MDAIELLERDHAEIEEMFEAFEEAGKRAFRAKRALVDRMIEALSRHAAIEEGLLYPTARKALRGKDDDIVLELLEEHHVVKWTLHELEDLEPEHERFDAKVDVLMANVRYHVHEEEEHLFPMLREAINARALDQLGAQLEKAKRVAPLRPHPRSPDTPPGNLLSTPVVSLIDRAQRAAKSAPQAGARTLRSAVAARVASEGKRKPTRGGAKKAGTSARARAPGSSRATGRRRSPSRKK